MGNILIKNAAIAGVGAGSIAIEGNVITQVGEVSDFRADTMVDASGFIALPGLVNAHTHSAMGVFRNYADDLSFADWLFGKIIPAENKLMPEDIYWGTLLGICEMLKSGTTCFIDMYMHYEEAARAISESGIRANISYGPITSAVRGGGLVVSTDKASSFIRKWKNAADGRINTSMEIHSVYLFDEPSITEAAALAKELGTGIHIHLSESDSELEMSSEKYKLLPVEAAEKFGVLDAPGGVIAAHCVKLSDNDIEILKAHHVNPVHCPSSNLKLGNGFAPIPRLLAEGLNVCLGTDGAASNNNLNMFEEAHLAALIHKGAGGNAQVMPAAQVIRMATENGARALGFADCGRLEVGCKADIVLVDANKPHLCPVNDATAALIYSAQAADVDTVIVDGKILVRGGKLTTLDEEKIMSKVKETARRVLLKF